MNLKETDKNLLETDFYENPFEFSYSSLNTLLTAPGAFYKEYVLRYKNEEIKKYLIEGILIHYLILEYQNFDDKFVVLPGFPSENNILIADRIFNEVFPIKGDATLELIDFENEIDAILKEMNLYQSIKDRDKRLAKIIEPKTEEYFSFLKTSANKIIIDSALLDVSTKRANIAKANPELRKLLGLDLVSDGKTIGVYNELEILIPAKETGLPFGFKGRIDNMVVLVNEKKVLINDFKTTSKGIADFSESIKVWNYWLQAVIYKILAEYYLRSFLDSSWTIEFRFIVFDKYNLLYPFLVTPETMADWMEKFEDVKKQALYHYQSKDFSLPFAFATGSVKL